MKKKLALIIVAVILVAAIAVGGTMAWLTSTPAAVTNTFTVGKVSITLTETPNAKSSPDAEANDIWQAQLIPGTTYGKDPTVSVSADSEDCWLFVKFEEINNPATYLSYTSTLTAANGWTQGNGTDIPENVWYRVVEKTAKARTWKLLAGNEDYANGFVTVIDTVGGTVLMPTADKAPSIVYTAYAIQKANIDSPVDAWAKLNPANPATP